MVAENQQVSRKLLQWHKECIVFIGLISHYFLLSLLEMGKKIYSIRVSVMVADTESNKIISKEVKMKTKILCN